MPGVSNPKLGRSDQILTQRPCCSCPKSPLSTNCAHGAHPTSSRTSSPFPRFQTHFYSISRLFLMVIAPDLEIPDTDEPRVSLHRAPWRTAGRQSQVSLATPHPRHGRLPDVTAPAVTSYIRTPPLPIVGVALAPPAPPLALVALGGAGRACAVRAAPGCSRGAGRGAGGERRGCGKAWGPRDEPSRAWSGDHRLRPLAWAAGCAARRTKAAANPEKPGGAASPATVCERDWGGSGGSSRRPPRCRRGAVRGGGRGAAPTSSPPLGRPGQRRAAGAPPRRQAGGMSAAPWGAGGVGLAPSGFSPGPRLADRTRLGPAMPALAPPMAWARALLPPPPAFGLSVLPGCQMG